MTISKKLFLATAMLATCVSSIKLHADEDKKNRAAATVFLSSLALGPSIIAGNISRLRLAKQLKAITISGDLLKKAESVKTRGRVGLVIGTALSLSTILSASTLLNNQETAKNNPSA